MKNVLSTIAVTAVIAVMVYFSAKTQAEFMKANPGYVIVPSPVGAVYFSTNLVNNK